MRARRGYAFKPNTSPALEERVVLSDAGLMAPIAVEAAQMAATANQDEGFRFPTEMPGRSPIIDQLEGRMNLAFSNFADDYRELRSAYFSAVESLLVQEGGDPVQTLQDGDNGDNNNNGDNGDQPVVPIQAPQTLEGLAESFGQAVRERAGQLRDQVNTELDDVQGGGGLLNNFGRARVDQLAHELTNLDPIGVGQLNQVEYALLGEYAIADSLYATRQFIQVYDAALFQTASGIFSGNLRFFRGGTAPTPEEVSQVSPAVGPVLGEMNGVYGAFADDLRALRSDYSGTIGENNNNDDNFEAYRTSVAERTERLRTDVIDALNRVPGGAGVLNQFATEQLNQVQLLLANMPPLGTTPFGVDAHARLTEEIMARSVNDMSALVQLYDISLSTTALNFFNANPRFATQGPASPGVGTPGGAAGGVAGGTDGVQVASAAQTAGGAAGQFPGGLIGTNPGFGGGVGGGVVPGVGGVTNPGGLTGAIPGDFTGVGPGNPFGTVSPTGLAGTQFSPGAFFGTTPAGFDPGLGFGGLGGGVNFGTPTNFGTGFGFGNTGFRGLGPLGGQIGQQVGFGTGGAFGLGNQFGVLAGPGLGTGAGVGFGGFFL